MKNRIFALFTAMLLAIGPAVWAQKGNAKKEDKEDWKRDRKEAKEEMKRDRKEAKEDWKDATGRGRGNARTFPGRGNRFPRNTPRELASVPKGHYPPPGMCRLWFPSLPPGQQRPPQPCGELQRLSFGDGAFILYNDKAYDLDYDWRKREAERVNSVPREILGFYQVRD
ncbi:hypothetical protein GCM10023189_16400 [Nibrella saemangeumensis]|uniref:Uncharacterized protein n=1 Tax=Nibrella saemangeumensis TaxID=1084526 RepID=A0ABP8MLI2_9BACT